MRARATSSTGATASSEPSANSPVGKTLELIDTLLGSLPAKDRERFFREVAEKVKPLSAPRAGEVLGAVVEILPQKDNWSVAELIEKVDDKGISSTAKEVYNAISYLAKKGRVRRVGYGRYVIDGALLETADDLGGENARHEDSYRTDRSTE